jgi:hypothetical protein
MLLLSSHPEQSKKRKNKVKQNIRFILSHFKEPIFPRTISSRSTEYDATQLKVAYSEKDMFRIYEQSEFIDCKVSIYRSSYAQERLDDQRIADLIIFNVYKPIFMRESVQIKALYVILDAIKKILAGKPTILRSTSSFHIYQPIEPHPLEQIKQFIDHIIRQYPELQLILKFPGQIFDSCPSMLLIPGTFGSNIEKTKKEYEEIMLIQKWDGSRPRMVSPVLDFLLRPYVRYDHQADSKAFLICRRCFWCASNLSTKKVITKCPICDNNALLNSMPISDKEVYEIDSSQRRRFKMEPSEYCANVTT